MGLVIFRLRSERRNATRWISAILLIALAATAALVAAQAARRTDTAFTRGLSAQHSADVVVSANAFGNTTKQTAQRRARGAKLLDAIDASPLVVAHSRAGGVSIYRVDGDHIDQRLNTGSAFGLAAYDPRAERTLAALRIQSGRFADVDDPDEIVISPATAKVTGWRLGTRVTDLRIFSPEDLDENGTPRVDAGTPLSLTVVGIGTLPEELLQVRSVRVPRVFLTPAFQQRHPDSIFYLNELLRLRNGLADTDALRALVAKVNATDPDISMPVAPTVDGLRKVESANTPLVNGMWVIAALAALVGLLLVAQSLGQALSARGDEQAQLRALGATRAQRLAIEVAIVAAAALVAAILAVLLGFLLSPLTPIGGARDAEPHPGFAFSLALSALAIPLTVLGTGLAALPATWRRATDVSLPGPGAINARERRSRIADAESQAGLSVPAVVGTRLAFQPGRGRSATPVRSVLASLTLVVATVTATFAFGANLQHSTTTPRLYGWNWDAAAGSGFGTIPPQFVDEVQKFPNVIETSALTVGILTVAGKAIPAIGIDPLHGNVLPELTSGRRAENPGEIVLGARTMRQVHTHVGQSIDAVVGTKKVHLLVVGTTTFPAFGGQHFGESGLGTGALGTTALFPVHDETNPDGRFNYVLMRFAPGTAAQAETDLRPWLADRGCPDSSCLLADSRPAEIDGYRNARGLPFAVGIVLVLFLVASLVHALVSTMRRRRSDLAILRALGCSPRDLVATMRWQGLMLTASAVIVGVPVGLVAGRFAWQAFASHIGILPTFGWPVGAIAVGAIALIVIATAVAAIVGRRVPAEARRFRVTT